MINRMARKHETLKNIKYSLQILIDSRTQVSYTCKIFSIAIQKNNNCLHVKSNSVATFSVTMECVPPLYIILLLSIAA